MGDKYNDKKEENRLFKNKFPEVPGQRFKGQSGKMLKRMYTVLERLPKFELTKQQHSQKILSL